MKSSLNPKFTLLELLIVIAIIGVLLTLLLPSLTRAKVVSMTALSKNNLNQIYKGVLIYSRENNNFLCKIVKNPLPTVSNPDSSVNWPRLTYEMMKGNKYKAGQAKTGAEMTNDVGYMGTMFCPVKRYFNEEKPSYNYEGKGDYSMNIFFIEYRNLARITSGKEEPFITPGVGETKASPALKKGSPDSKNSPYYNYAHYKSFGLYIDGSISLFTKVHGTNISPLISDESTFE